MTRVARQRLKKDPQFNQRMAARFGGPAPTTPAPAFSKNERFYSDISRCFIEIDTSLDALRALPRLARRAPSPAAKVSATSYLRFLVESYLQEVYVCSKRLDAFTSKLGRLYRKDEPSTADALRKLKRAIVEGFGPICKLRGRYVHETRDFDEDLSVLSTFQLLVGEDAPEYVAALRSFRKIKLQWMHLGNIEIDRFLGEFFDALCRLLLHRNGRIRVPPTYRAS